MFKTELLIYQSRANLDEKFLFGDITHQFYQEFRKMLARYGACLGTRVTHSILVDSLLVIEVKIPFLNLTI